MELSLPARPWLSEPSPLASAMFPQRLPQVLGIAAWLGCVCSAAGGGATEPALKRQVDFVNDVMPIFTKHGCNSGACHGAAAGRGGLHLSLYGGDPVADYEAIVLQLEGRRINLALPEQSLILLKPTETIAHGGGYLLEDDDPGLALLTQWIAQGGRYSHRRTLLRVEVTPHRQVAGALGERIDVRARAIYEDGPSRDVTGWTVWTPEDTTAVTVELQNEAAALRVHRRGRHVVVARYLDQVVPLEVLLPWGSSRGELLAASEEFIDQEIAGMLDALGIPASPLTDERTLRRRLTLHLCGRLPDSLPEELRDEGLSREALVDRLLASDAFVDYWTYRLAKLLRVRPQQGDTLGAEAYQAWIAQQVRNGVAYDEVARSLVLAEGDSHLFGPANFYRTTGGPREQAEFFSEVFMASRLRCANCHNHPLDRWTQDDYHGLAAIFARVERGQVIGLRPRGEVIHPRTLEPAPARIPGATRLAEDVADGRQALATWLTSAENPYFAKAIVNRLWKHLMGRGLVEPVDDFRATNPATHPALLDQLAEDFATHGYDIRHTLRRIALSQAYARSAVVLPENQDDDRFYSRRLVTPLEPEVLADAISDVLGVAERYGEEALGVRAVTLVNPLTPSPSLDILGRCDREDGCETAEGQVGGLSQKLHLFNGPLLNARLRAPHSRLQRALTEQRPALEIVEEFYSVALGREPSFEEREFWQAELDSASAAGNEQHADELAGILEDFVWALLTSREFVTNH